MLFTAALVERWPRAAGIARGRSIWLVMSRVRVFRALQMIVEGLRDMEGASALNAKHLLPAVVIHAGIAARALGG